MANQKKRSLAKIQTTDMKRLINGLTVLFLLTFFISCQKEVSLEKGAPATGSLQNNLGDCLPKTVKGSFVAAKALTDSNFIEVTVNVTTPGSYTIITDTVNGYSFKASGVFSTAGSSIVKLAGNGKPVTSGTNDFTVFFDTSFCDIQVVVLPAGAGGPASYSLPGNSSNCSSNFSPSGNYVKSVALSVANTVTVQVSVGTIGTYSVTTNTVNGYSFTGSGTFGTTGTQSIVLQGSGTPLAAQTDSFTVTVGSSTCKFGIVVSGTAPPPPVPNNDYFPTTANSWWSYNYGTGAADTFKVTNAGPTAVFSGNTYQRFVYSDAGGPYLDEFYRKDATGAYYRSDDTAGFGPQVTFSQPRLDILFLKNNLSTGDSLVSDFAAVLNAGTSGTFSGTFRFKFKVINANASITVNGKSFTNVYQLRSTFEFGVLGVFFDITADPTDYYYVKGIGLVKLNDSTYFQDIRYWLVN